MVTFKTHGRFIYGEGETKHWNEWKYKVHRHKKRLHPPIWNFFFQVEILSGGFVKERMRWISCDGGLHLAQISCRWNNWDVPCPLAVAWISFILVVIERVHGICKDLNGDGSPLYWNVWSPYNTHHLVMLLQVMPSYFSTVPIAERKTFIFTLHTLVRGSNISA